MKKRKKSKSISKRMSNSKKLFKQKKLLVKVLNKKSKKKIIFSNKKNSRDFAKKQDGSQLQKALVFKTYDKRNNKPDNGYDKRRNTEKKQESQFKMLLNQNQNQQEKIVKLNIILKQQKQDQSILEQRLKQAKEQIRELQVQEAKKLLNIKKNEVDDMSNLDTNIPTQNYYIPIPMQEEKNYDSQQYDSEFTEETVHECQNMSLIMFQCIDAFLRENEEKSNPLAQVLEKVITDIQERNEEQNDMELFMYILKEMDLFLRIKIKEQNKLKSIIKDLLTKQLQKKQQIVRTRKQTAKKQILVKYFEGCIEVVRRQLAIDEQDANEEFFSNKFQAYLISQNKVLIVKSLKQSICFLLIHESQISLKKTFSQRDLRRNLMQATRIEINLESLNQ